MDDAEIVKSRLKAIIDFNEIGNGRTVVRKDVLNDAPSVIEELQAEIERLKEMQRVDNCERCRFKDKCLTGRQLDR